MDSISKLRIDKYLWCIRVYKSRTLATEACDGGKVKIGGERIKPSRPVKLGEEITVQQGFIKKVYKVIGFLDKRVAAKLVINYAEDITPKEEIEKAQIAKFVSYQSKYQDTGRPTKKDRRLLQKYRNK